MESFPWWNEEQKRWVNLYRGRKGIELVKTTYEGLKRQIPLNIINGIPHGSKKRISSNQLEGKKDGKKVV